ncbi:MAG: hypothetical protein B6I22_03540 [Desulfobacteraceae bacterium 4572_123]|nr:MAG: hypothetical protein B6I22_03540 [Desulfobacteraceae bacterium 4572_123]
MQVQRKDWTSNVTPLGYDMVNAMRGAVNLGRRVAVIIIDLYGSNFGAQGLRRTHGSGGVGPAYQRGFLDYGFNVITSRYILASGGRALRSQDGWPYMGPCNL